MWTYIVLAFVIILPLILFRVSSNTVKKMNKDMEKNPYDYRNNPPPPPSGPGIF